MRPGERTDGEGTPGVDPGAAADSPSLAPAPAATGSSLDVATTAAAESAPIDVATTAAGERPPVDVATTALAPAATTASANPAATAARPAVAASLPGEGAPSVAPPSGDGAAAPHLDGEAIELSRFPEENPDPVLRIRADGVVGYANAAARSLLAPLSLAPGAAVPAALAPHVSRAASERRRLRVELAVGASFFTFHFVPAGDGVNVYAQDTTARRHAEEELRAALERLSLHVTGTPLAVVEWDAEYRVTRFSERAEQLLGWSAAEVVGKRIDELPWIPAEDWPSVRAVMRDMAAGTRPRNVNANRNLRKDGAVVYCEWYNSALHDAEGRLSSVLSFVLDVTGRERALEALREAHRRKDDFLAVLSHELRNPLGPIRNGVEVLGRAAPGSAAAERARETVLRQSEHLSRIVDDLLEVTRIARGKVALRRERLDAAELVRRVCEDHRSLFDARGVALCVDAPAPAWVEGDPVRLAQVVGNLLENAAKFSAEGGATAVSVAAADGAAEVRVRDDGAGMAPGLLARLFEPFAQADETLARSQGGLGLGLALVKGLTELHGGAVRAHSAGPGRGAEFTVRLPLCAGAPRAEAAPPPACRAASGSARRVLVVEDNPDAAQTLADLLRLWGHEVRVEHDGRSGVAAARAWRPDVVFCDIGLPGESGYDVARELRADPGLSCATLVALSGYARPEDRASALGAGFDAHLAKPAPLEELQALLAEEPSGG